jgi:hypothetical protein
VHVRAFFFIPMTVLLMVHKSKHIGNGLVDSTCMNSP